MLSLLWQRIVGRLRHGLTAAASTALISMSKLAMFMSTRGIS
jgi:hypothetical protein